MSLRDGKPWYFMEEKYPEMGNLMPRDVVSREIWQIMNAPDGSRTVFLDMTQLPSGVMERRLGDLAEDCGKGAFLPEDLPDRAAAGGSACPVECGGGLAQIERGRNGAKKRLSDFFAGLSEKMPERARRV